MSIDLIRKIRTETGDKQIDYEALANLPDLSGYAKQSDLSELQATVNDKASQTEMNEVKDQLKDISASETTGISAELTTAFRRYFTNMQTLLTQFGYASEDNVSEILIQNAKDVVAVLGGGEAEAPTLSHISATYTGGQVTVGTALTDLTGITVTAHYSDGSTANVTDYTLSGTIVEGSNTITVSYGGKTTTFTVTGIAVEEEPEIIEAQANTVVTANFDVTGTIVTDGVASSNGGWVATDYIEIPDGMDYVAWETATAYAYRGAFYDSDKNYIRNITNSTSIASATLVSDEVPENTKYIRLSSNTASIGSINVSCGKNMASSWGTTRNNKLNEDGTVTENYTGTVQQYITNGYTKIPTGATRLIFGGVVGYKYRYIALAVYDSNYNFLKYVNRDVATTGSPFRTIKASETIDLTELTDSCYIKVGAWDNGDETNNNPVEQILVGYI